MHPFLYLIYMSLIQIYLLDIYVCENLSNNTVYKTSTFGQMDIVYFVFKLGSTNMDTNTDTRHGIFEILRT